MAGYGWGERGEIKRDAVNEYRGQIVDRENRLEEREKQLEKDKRGFELEKVFAEEVAQHNAKITDKKTELKDVDLSIQTTRLSAKESDLESNIQRLKDAHAAELLVKEAEWKAQGLEKYTALLQTSAVDRATSDAKDKVIEAAHKEIARLDELLKVTMGKLTQIDIKGLTIHVESAKGGGEKKAQ